MEQFILRKNRGLSEHLLHKEGQKEHMKMAGEMETRYKHANGGNPTPRVIVKLSPFVDDITLYIENPEDSAKI